MRCVERSWDSSRTFCILVAFVADGFLVGELTYGVFARSVAEDWTGALALL